MVIRRRCFSDGKFLHVMRSQVPRLVGVRMMITVTHSPSAVPEREGVRGWAVIRGPLQWSIPGPPQHGHRRKCVKGFPQCLRAPRGQEKQLLIFRLKVGHLLSGRWGVLCLYASPDPLGMAQSWEQRTWSWSTPLPHSLRA